MRTAANLPDRFCWTRFGTESGQPIGAILDRKERERRANGGLFLWGIGNSVGPGIRELVRCCTEPEVLFSPIRSRPRSVNVAPRTVVAWTTAATADGQAYMLPTDSMVVSGHERPPYGLSHYALVCYSASPLVLDESGPSLAFDRLRNIQSGRPLGSSQVTAVVVRDPGPPALGREYAVSLRATLVYPHFVRLHEPVVLSCTTPDGTPLRSRSARTQLLVPSSGGERLGKERS